MKTLNSLVPVALLMAVGSSALACNPDTGERRQMVFLEAGGDTVEYWEVVPGQLKSVKLPSGASVGVTLTPAGVEKYATDWNKGKYVPELVQIRIFDLSGSAPVEKEMSWGGTNSVQAFGRNSKPGDAGIFGHGGFTLNLLKAVCASREAVAAELVAIHSQ